MVGVAVEGAVEGVDPERIEAEAEILLGLVDQADAELSVLLCDDVYIQPLNAQWRDKDEPTDVLSFPQNDPVVLGDVVISVQTAARQADQAGHPLVDEIRVLLAHGLLHLLGHDHHDPDEAQQMRDEEVRLLAGLGVDGAASLVGRGAAG